MTSDAKISANQANSAKSTGPVTPEGKETVSGNSVKHGLSGSGKHGILPEERADLAKLLDELIEYHKPVGPEENRLLISVAENTIRVRRAHRMEAALFADALRDGEQGADPDSVLARAWVDPGKGFQRIATYAARIQRTIDRDSAKLSEIQTARKAAYAKAQEEAILLCKLNFETGHKFRPADHFPPDGDFGGFVFADGELAKVITRASLLKQARTRFGDPAEEARRRKSDAAALRELEALIG